LVHPRVSDVCSENPVTAELKDALDDALQRMASEHPATSRW
jgi:hypothetical protein